MRVQGLHAAPRRTTCSSRQQVTSIVFDVELIYLARRRGYRIAIVPIRWERPPRLADARATGSGPARRLGPVPDPAPPSSRPASRARCSDGVATRLPRVALVVVALLAFEVIGLALVDAAASRTSGYDFQAYLQAASRVLDGAPLYDLSVDVAGGFAIFLYPPPFGLAFTPFALASRDVALWHGTAILVGSLVDGDRDPAGPATGPLDHARRSA